MKDNLRGVKMDIHSIIESMWLYSKNYSSLLSTVVRLRENGESYAALLVLFNMMELVFKSIREDDTHNLIDDVNWLYDNGLLTENEKQFINSENGVRTIRNKMTHKDCYSYCIEINDVAYPFAEKETWDIIYDLIAPNTILIISNVISQKS